MEKAQSGRSLLEMLMTLVVMGILTVGSVAGYKAISVRFQKRTVAETISRLVLQRQHEALTRKGLETHSQNVAGPHGVSFDVANDTVNHFITIKVKGPNAELIQALAKEKFLMSMAESITTPEVVGEEASVIMIFNQFQSSNLSSHTAVSCAVGTIAGKGEASVLASDGHTQCYCDLGEMYEGEKCQRDQCFGITLNSCQTSCDKWTGNITTKADDTVCDFSATGNDGFCQAGECKENVEKDCTMNTDCKGGEYCKDTEKYENGSYVPATGKCDTLDDAVVATYNGKTFLYSFYGMPWWSARNWCLAYGKSLASLSDLGIIGGYEEKGYCQKDACTGADWTALKAAFGTNYYWTNDSKDSARMHVVEPREQYVSYAYRNHGYTPLCK